MILKQSSPQGICIGRLSSPFVLLSYQKLATHNFLVFLFQKASYFIYFTGTSQNEYQGKRCVLKSFCFSDMAHRRLDDTERFIQQFSFCCYLPLYIYAVLLLAEVIEWLIKIFEELFSLFCWFFFLLLSRISLPSLLSLPFLASQFLFVTFTWNVNVICLLNLLWSINYAI